jgi:hypothetical protein
MLRTAIVAAALLLAACEIDSGIDYAAEARADDALCQSWGLQYGSDDYGLCRMQLSSDREARYRAALGAWGAMSGFQTPTLQPRRTLPRQTHCAVVGDWLNCTSY